MTFQREFGLNEIQNVLLTTCEVLTGIQASGLLPWNSTIDELLKRIITDANALSAILELKRQELNRVTP